MDTAPLVGPEWGVSSGDTAEADRAETTGGLSLDGKGIVPPGARFVHLAAVQSDGATSPGGFQ